MAIFHYLKKFQLEKPKEQKSVSHNKTIRNLEPMQDWLVMIDGYMKTKSKILAFDHSLQTYDPNQYSLGISVTFGISVIFGIFVVLAWHFCGIGMALLWNGLAFMLNAVAFMLTALVFCNSVAFWCNPMVFPWH